MRLADCVGEMGDVEGNSGPSKFLSWRQLSGGGRMPGVEGKLPPHGCLPGTISVLRVIVLMPPRENPLGIAWLQSMHTICTP